MNIEYSPCCATVCSELVVGGDVNIRGQTLARDASFLPQWTGATAIMEQSKDGVKSRPPAGWSRRRQCTALRIADRRRIEASRRPLRRGRRHRQCGQTSSTAGVWPSLFFEYHI